MNDVLAGKIVSPGHLGLAGLTTVQCAALCKQFSSCSTMNGSVHTAASEEGAVRCVYDSFHIIDFRNITSDGPNDRVSNFHTILLIFFEFSVRHRNIHIRCNNDLVIRIRSAHFIVYKSKIEHQTDYLPHPG